MDPTYLDQRNFNRHLNDVYYEINPKNKDEYRTIHVRLNPFTQHPQGIRSNYINGIPPEHLKPIPPALNRRINSIPPTIPFWCL